MLPHDLVWPLNTKYITHCKLEIIKVLQKSMTNDDDNGDKNGNDNVDNSTSLYNESFDIKTRRQLL